MSRNLSWKPELGLDELGGAIETGNPYLHWATGPGREFLVSYRNPLRPIDALYFADPQTMRIAPGARKANRRDAIPVTLRAESVNDKPLRAASWTAPQSLAPVPEDLVIVGVVDDGIALANTRFHLPDARSRIDFAWIQGGRNAGSPAVAFGRELSRDAIEAGLADLRDRRTDEDRLHENWDVTDLTDGEVPTAAKITSHGTPVLDLAAGYDPQDLRVRNRIIAVQLPALANWDGAGLGLGFFFAAGMRYILERARLISSVLKTQVPVVINFSYGITGGPHDGSHFIERAIEDLIRDHKQQGGGHVEMVLPAGNDFLAQTHAQARAARTGRATLRLPWRLPPDDRSSSFLEIWLPQDAADIRVTVRPPGGAPILADWRAGSAGGRELRHADERSATVARLSFDRPGKAPDAKSRVVLAVAPTNTDTALPYRQPAAAGLWQVEVSAALAGKGDVIEGWIRREAPISGYPARGRASRIDDPTYRRQTDPIGGDWDEADSANGVVRKFGSLSGSATGPSPVVVGGYRDSDKRAAPYSSAAGAGMRQPDAMLVSEDSIALPGIPASGNKSGGTVRVSGTSFAAARMTRDLAENILAVAATPGGGRNYVQDAAASDDTLPDMNRNDLYIVPRKPRQAKGFTIPAARKGKGRTRSKRRRRG